MERFLEAIYDSLMKGYRGTERASREVIDIWEVILSVLWVVAKVAFCLYIGILTQFLTIVFIYRCFNYNRSVTNGFGWSLVVVWLFIDFAIGESIFIVAAYNAFRFLFSFRLILSEESSAPDRFNPIDDNEVDTVDPLQF